MNRIEKMIADMCPDGVEWKELGEVCEIKRGRVLSKQYLEENIGEYPVYSSQTLNSGMIGKISTYDFDGEYGTWTTDGAYAGTVFFRSGKFSITNICGLIKPTNEEFLSVKFIVYFLQIEAKKHVKGGSGNPKLMSNVMSKIKIPIPPLAIQKEIVKILDKMTKHVTELTAELTKRTKQYEYYRENLLTFEDHTVEWKTLGEVCDYVDYRGKTPKKVASGTYLVTAKNIKKGYIDYEVSKEYVSENEYDEIMRRGKPKIGDIIITTEAPYGNVAQIDRDDVALAQRVIKYSSKDEKYLLNNFIKCYLLGNEFQKKLDKIATGGTVKGVKGSLLHTLTIPIPAVKIQEKIVYVLDNFDKVCNDLNIGLPKEIALRQKEYEYYREKLLTFDSVSDTHTHTHDTLTY